MQAQVTSFKPSTATSPAQIIQQWLINQLAEQLSLDSSTIDVNEPLTRYGLDSIDAVTLVGDLEDALDEELPDTLFWDHPTIAQSSQYLVENFDLEEAVANLETEAAAPAKVETPKETKKGGWGLFGRNKG
ncbi:MAG: acyl carrier protein [Microcystaceae cyanobacterium]